MHELSIAMSILDMAEEEAGRRSAEVNAIHVKLGLLSGVAKEALVIGLRSGSHRNASRNRRKLIIEEIPVMIYCPRCRGASQRSFHPAIVAAANAKRRRGNPAGPGTASGRAGATRMNSPPRILEVRKNILKHNDEVAHALRNRFRGGRRVCGEPGLQPGLRKNAFLEATLTKMRSEFRVAALVGDLATENDAKRLARSQVPVRQIITGTVCHLEAAMIENSLEDWNLDELDFLFIENVGNLVCPSSYDLGENLRVVRCRLPRAKTSR